MKSREISRSKIGPFSLACTDPYIGIGWEYQSTNQYSVIAIPWRISSDTQKSRGMETDVSVNLSIEIYYMFRDKIHPRKTEKAPKYPF